VLRTIGTKNHARRCVGTWNRRYLEEMRRYLEPCKGMPPYTTFPFEKGSTNAQSSAKSNYLTLELAELPAGSRVAMAGNTGVQVPPGQRATRCNQ
jgi:hypothetical protein